MTTADTLTIIARVDDYAESCADADRWAHLAHKAVSVVKHADRYFLADKEDLKAYHAHDIALGRASVVYVAQPAVL